MKPFGLTALAGGVVVWAAGVASGRGPDNFESYAFGSFPSANWLDARTLIPVPTTASPSGTIITTTGPAGTTTKAFQTRRAVGTSQGLAAIVEPASVMQIAANVRYDRWDNSTNQNGGGWPLALGFFQRGAGVDPNFGPQVTLFADSTFRKWSLYIQTSFDSSQFQFIQLTTSITPLNTWFFMSLQVNTQTGSVTAQVRRSNLSTFVVNQTLTIPGWNPAFARYDAAGALDGEYFTNATLGGQATVDDLEIIVPGPWPAGPAACAGGMVLLRRGRRTRRTV